MIGFSEGDYIFIQKNPLRPKIGHLREDLERAAPSLQATRSQHLNPVPPHVSSDSRSTTDSESESGSKTESAPTSDAPNEEPSTDTNVKGVLLNLVLALQGHNVAQTFRYTGSSSLTGELAILVNRLDSDRVDVALFLPLVSTIIQDSPSDIQIWKAAIELISSTQRQTPPPSESSYSGTPRTFSSASLQGSDQTKRLLNPLLRREFQHRTYEFVPEFYEKHFECRWTEREGQVANQLRKEHKDGRWTDFPEIPTESKVWEWWSAMQQRHLQDARGVFYTTKSQAELTGTDTQRQLDMLMKHRNAPSLGKHDWADVRVVGEHKCSYTNPNEKFLQLARYVRDIFKAQPTRRFVHAFLLLETCLEPFIFDRSGAYSGVPFDIHAEPERFVRVFLGYATMSNEQLGLDTFIELRGKKRQVTVDTLEGHDSKRLQLEWPPIFKQNAIVCRGTSVYRTTDRSHVVKFSWRSNKRPREADHFRDAHARGVRGIVQLTGTKEITSIADLRQGLTFSRKRKFRHVAATAGSFSESQSLTKCSHVEGLSLQDGKRKSMDAGRRPSKKSRSNSQGSNPNQEVRADEASFTEAHVATRASGAEGEEPFRDRILTCLAISPAGRPLYQFDSISELLRCLRDAIKAHRSLFIDGRILHRDISLSNIIITDPKDANGFYGMLIDMDLSTQIDAHGKNQRSGASQMTGTLKYMAIEVLELAFRDAQPDLDHTYRHDLESFFYVFLDICISCRWRTNAEDGSVPKTGSKSNPDPLIGWYVGSFQDIADAKSGQMVQNRFETSFLSRFDPAYEGLKDLAMRLRNILFRDGALFTGTPSDSSQLYLDMINAFDHAIVNS